MTRPGTFSPDHKHDVIDVSDTVVNCALDVTALSMLRDGALEAAIYLVVIVAVCLIGLGYGFWSLGYG